MTATARTDTKTVDWKVWVPGVITPIACFVVDYIMGEYVLGLAPAALLAFAAIGIASLVISRNWRQNTAGLVAVGPLWVVGGLTFVLGIPLAVVSGLVFSLVPTTGVLVAFMTWGLLGLTPLWTGLTYLGEARALTVDQVARHGRLKIALFGLAGGVTAVSLAIAAQALDSHFLAARVAALDQQAPEAWHARLQSLNAYPLCLRYRCRRHVCSHLYGQFGQDPSMLFTEGSDFPGEIGSAFRQAYGLSVSEACRPVI